jgi:hypothetical protein
MSQSFTGETVPIPPGLGTKTLPLEPGDVLFFNGSLIHGSPPNRSDRFRTIIVGHYIEGDAECVAHYYFPVYRMDGSTVEIERSPDGQPCGVFVDKDGEQVFEYAGSISEAKAAH